MRTVLVAAADGRWGIGREGGIPWDVPADMRRFRRRTMGLPVVVGRATAETLPGGLPGRRLVTVSASGRGDFRSVREAAAALEAEGAPECVVAGGAGIYREALAFGERAEITRVRGDHGCDAFMPDLREAGWTLLRVERGEGIELETWKGTAE